MNIKPHNIKVKDLFEGYEEDFTTDSVVGYGGKLDIRPKYQRAFVYKDKQREAVIDTLQKGYPLNVMYWAVRPDGTYEVIDGQQRTISICQYLQGDFSHNGLYFSNLPADKRQEIENYELTVYFCEGTESEKLEWFKTINIAGEELTAQELRNAVFVGSWVVDAKKYFSNIKGMAYLKWKDYLCGDAIRQDYLETVIDWISNGEIDDYMGKHQHDLDATDLKVYFETVMNWVTTLFPHYRKEMKSPQWGRLYNLYQGNKYSATALEKRVVELMADDEVQKKSAVYEYLLGGEQVEHADKILNLRGFTLSQRRAAYEKQKGVCPICKKHFEFEEMHGDHIVPWSKGGKTTPDNLQMLCTTDNLAKSNN